jgi:hypothetical protein
MRNGDITMPPAAAEPVGPIRRGFRYAYLILIWLFLLGVIGQFFLAGYAAFGGISWEIHQGMGHTVSYPTLLLLVFVFAGWLPRPMPLLTGFLVLLLVGQIALAMVGDDTPIVGAFHPLNALVIAGLAAHLAWRARQFVPPPLGWATRPPAAPSHELRSPAQ